MQDLIDKYELVIVLNNGAAICSNNVNKDAISDYRVLSSNVLRFIPNQAIRYKDGECSKINSALEVPFHAISEIYK